MAVLPRDFYENPDVLHVARSLIGKRLVTTFDGQITAGRIVETEAYAGITDRASHAYGDRRTARTEAMYGNAGTAYVYLCYGIHHLFNVVTNVRDIPHAVLIRAVEPLEGQTTMQRRRDTKELHPRITAGPGSLSRAFGITTAWTGHDLTSPPLVIEDAENVPDNNIIASPRVGVEYAGEDAALPWRFRLRDSRWTSPAK